METPLPNTEKLQSLNVEQSRAKRLEHQQARLRDRGGIFRPENRNNNLFDILIQATHRKSPAKGRSRSRSRSRSVSPQKKATTTPNTRPRKITPRMDVISELPEDDSELQLMTQKSKGKQKQASEADLNEDETSKPKPRAKKAAPAKKNKAPRQTSKKAVIAAGDISKEKVGPPKARQNKPKGRRKKADIVQEDVVELPPPKAKKTRTAKSKSIPKVATDEAPGVDDSSKPEKPKPATMSSTDVADKAEDDIPFKPIKIGPPSKKAKRDASRSKNPPDDQAAPTKSRPTKRKAEPEVIDEEDELRPSKRRAPIKPRSEASTNRDTKAPKSRTSKTNSTSQALVDAINDAAGTGSQVKSDKIPSEPKTTAKKSKAPATEPSASASDQLTEEVQPPAAPKRKRKRTVPAQTEVDEQVEKVTKKPKTAPAKPKKRELHPKTAAVPESKDTPSKANSSKEDKEDEGGQEDRPLKTLSRKRKENATAAKTAKATTAPKNNKSRAKQGSCIPLHVKQKLDAQHDSSLPDEEADPIDFLS